MSESKITELVQFFSKICVSEDTSRVKGPKARSLEASSPSEDGCSEVIRTSKAGNLKVDITSEAHLDDEAFEEVQMAPQMPHNPRRPSSISLLIHKS